MFIISPIGIESITLQHDRADEIVVLVVYTKANLITKNIVLIPCLKCCCFVCERNIYRFTGLRFLIHMWYLCECLYSQHDDLKVEIQRYLRKVFRLPLNVFSFSFETFVHLILHL